MANAADRITRGFGILAENQRRKRQREIEEEQRERQRKQDRLRRSSLEAELIRQGVIPEGVEQTREGGSEVTLEGRPIDVREDLPREGLETRTRTESETPLLSGERGLTEGMRVEGMASGGRPELEPKAGQNAGTEASGLRQAFSEEMRRAASAPAGAEPDIEPGELDPETGSFASQPVFSDDRGGAGGGGRSRLGRVLRGEGRVERQSPEFQLSTGARFSPGAEEQRVLEQEVSRIMAARPDLDRAEAELLAQGPAQALTFGREEPEPELDRTYNVRGREFEDREQAVAADRAFNPPEEDRGESLTQQQKLARQHGFENMADFRRFQDRVDSLREVYGSTQGDPVIQKALEARAMGLSESDVLDRIRNDARKAGYSDAEIERLEQDLRSFFSQRSRRQIEALQSGNLGDLPNFGSGFDLEFSTPSDTTGASGGGGEGGRGPLRDRGGGR